MTTHDLNEAGGTATGWWKESGPVLCPYCEQPHHTEAMLYCGVCDEVVCAVCVVVGIGSDPRCPACHGISGEM